MLLLIGLICDDTRSAVASKTADPEAKYEAAELALGDFLYHSPRLFGERAQKLGLTCDACHPEGLPGKAVFIDGLSDRPGNVDPKTSFFTAGSVSGPVVPINIPSLRGANHTAPYGRDGRINSLKIFIENVVIGEFGGSPQPLDRLRALTTYVASLDFLPNHEIEAAGELTAQASRAAKRGERLFNTIFAGLSGRSCASCHVPDQFFTDGRVYQRPIHADDPSASLAPYKTPTLLNITVTAPYFHDGRMAGINDVVSWYNRYFQLSLSDQDRTDLSEYVSAVGAVDKAPLPETARERFIRISRYLTLLVVGPAADDREIWTSVLQQVHDELTRASGQMVAQPVREKALERVSAISAAVAASAPLEKYRNEISDIFQNLMRLAVDWQDDQARSAPHQLQ